MIAALKRIALSRVFRGEKIVGHRDHGKEDEDEQRERDDLQSPAFAPGIGARSTAEPQADQRHCDRGAREIEE